MTEAMHPSTLPVDQLKPEEVLKHTPEKTVVLTDIGRDPDDMMAFILASQFTHDQVIDIKGVISTLTPASQRAKLARYTLDKVGLPNVPIGVGSDLPSLSAAHVHAYEFRGLPDGQPEERTDGSQVFEKTLQEADDQSLNMLVIASFTDLSKYLANSENSQNLFKRKVKNVIVMGGLETENGQVVRNDKGFFLPDTSANYQFDQGAANYVFDFLQTTKIPMTLVSRYAVNAAQLPRKTFDSLSETGHPIGEWLKDVSEEGFKSLWERVNLPIGDPQRALPDRCDTRWFFNTFCGGKEVKSGENIWPYIEKISAYDPFAMLAVSPSYTEQFFIPTEVTTNGTTHKVIGVYAENTGIKNTEEIQTFMKQNLISALQESLPQ